MLIQFQHSSLYNNISNGNVDVSFNYTCFIYQLICYTHDSTDYRVKTYLFHVLKQPLNSKQYMRFCLGSTFAQQIIHERWIHCTCSLIKVSLYFFCPFRLSNLYLSLLHYFFLFLHQSCCCKFIFYLCLAFLFLCCVLPFCWSHANVWLN